MITMREWLDLVQYKITEGTQYMWTCYGDNAYTLSSWNGIHGKGGYSFDIVFDTKTQEVYEVEVCDYTNDRAYRMIHTDYFEKHQAEGCSINIDSNSAWDDVKYVNLEVDDDFIEKSLAIVAGNVYDTRIIIDIDLDEDIEIKLMKMAHERDVTLNKMIEIIIRKQMIDDSIHTAS